MPNLAVVPFEPDHLDAAAELLVRRHDEHRKREPLLPDVEARPLLEQSLRRALSPVVAMRGGELVGYLVAREDELLGTPYALVDQTGCAVADFDVVPDLYAAAAADWVAAGLLRHTVFVPHDPRWFDPWFQLCFGASAVLALRDLAPLPAPDVAVEIRPSTPDDLPAVAELALLLDEQLHSSPSFSEIRRQTPAEHAEEWSDTWSEEKYVHFVAERDGQVVGHVLLYRRPSGDLRVPPDSIDLGNASTLPAVRGSGVGLALTAYVVEWARRNGYRSMTTDWRLTNLLAARFWPQRGFRPAFTRLERQLAPQPLP